MQVVIYVSPHESSELARCAQAMYANRCNAAGHMLSAIAATYRNADAHGIDEIRRIDRARAIYRAWLVFDEYPS